MINPGLRNPIWFGIVALTFILPSGCGVEAIHFSYIGYSWYYNDTIHEWVEIERLSIYFEPFNFTVVAGRLVHPHPVRTPKQGLRSRSTAVSSSRFSDRMQTAGSKTQALPSRWCQTAAPCLLKQGSSWTSKKFVGSPTTNTSENGVEFDMHIDSEFNDPNDIHIGMNLGSMISTATFTPPVGLAQNRSDVYVQGWQTLDIYIADCGVDKPLVLESIACCGSCGLGPAKKGVVGIIGIIFGIVGAICIGIAMMCWTYTQLPCPSSYQPIRFYLAHAGEDKNFTEQLYKDLKSTWRYKLNRIKVFIDRHSMSSGEDFTENIKRELNRTQVGVVVVSREFFERPWPMTELVYLVRSKQGNDRGVRILPLFYKLTVGEVKSMLRAGAWDGVWSENANHLDAKECRAAVKTLCKQHGVNYSYAERNNDVRYRQDVLNRVAEICNQMQKQRSRRNVED